MFCEVRIRRFGVCKPEGPRGCRRALPLRRRPRLPGPFQEAGGGGRVGRGLELCPRGCAWPAIPGGRGRGQKSREESGVQASVSTPWTADSGLPSPNCAGAAAARPGEGRRGGGAGGGGVKRSPSKPKGPVSPPSAPEHPACAPVTAGTRRLRGGGFPSVGPGTRRRCRFRHPGQVGPWAPRSRENGCPDTCKELGITAGPRSASGELGTGGGWGTEPP